MIPTAPPANLCNSLARLVRELEALPAAIRLQDLVAILRQAAPTAEELRDYIRFDEREYCHQTVHACERYEILCMGWLSGQSSTIHDHRGSCCCVRVVQGVLTNTDYVLNAQGELTAVRTRELPAGSLLPRQDRQIHRVWNRQSPGNELISLHVYAPPLTDDRFQVPATDPRY
jgi:cysteine dioxygenase